MIRDKHPYKVLVVEDNAGDFFLVKEYLEDAIEKPEVVRAEQFGQLQLILRKSPNYFDIILLDLGLTDKSGEELIRETSAIAGHVPIIVLTGYSDFSFAVKSLSMGAGDYLLKDELSAPILYKSIVYNIERNKNIINLKESEQRYSDLFHLSPQPMWVYDIDSLAFRDVNEAAILHYGYSHREFMGMTMRDLRPPGDKETTELGKYLINEPRQNGFFFQGIYKHRKKNKDVIYVDVRSNIIYNKGKQSEIILASDITERLMHVRAIEQQNIRLREIAWTQSHIVRAPLARMMSLIHLITSEKLSEKEARQLLSHVLSSAHELDSIVKEIVEKSQLIVPEKK